MNEGMFRQVYLPHGQCRMGNSVSIPLPGPHAGSADSGLFNRANGLALSMEVPDTLEDLALEGENPAGCPRRLLCLCWSWLPVHQHSALTSVNQLHTAAQTAHGQRGWLWAAFMNSHIPSPCIQLPGHPKRPLLLLPQQPQ